MASKLLPGGRVVGDQAPKAAAPGLSDEDAADLARLRAMEQRLNAGKKRILDNQDDVHHDLNTPERRTQQSSTYDPSLLAVQTKFRSPEKWMQEGWTQFEDLPEVKTKVREMLSRHGWDPDKPNFTEDVQLMKNLDSLTGKDTLNRKEMATFMQLFHEDLPDFFRNYSNAGDELDYSAQEAADTLANDLILRLGPAIKRRKAKATMLQEHGVEMDPVDDELSRFDDLIDRNFNALIEEAQYTLNDRFEVKRDLSEADKTELAHTFDRVPSWSSR